MMGDGVLFILDQAGRTMAAQQQQLQMAQERIADLENEVARITMQNDELAAQLGELQGEDKQ